MRALLDVNVLIALLDAGHIFHQQALDWLSREIRHGWSSCPLTQNGCVRIMSQPAYPGSFQAGDIVARLGEAAKDPHHEFWPADVDLLASGLIDWSKILGHRQVADAYLLALAVAHEGRFVTFDRRISVEVVQGATAGQLVILS
ncbi:TA system VapC family ribonuclease toxin [Geoalkalibacter sp.]|uniref:TA system VapC family ribonuclease toxin n=1 Tax=Geoalkalibacter sp. TaxID=3041440 RepID=UPI00272DF897|nr:TA system VapC family ribonuclease toxin [Geoalkalibacter sp.]